MYTSQSQSVLFILCHSSSKMLSFHLHPINCHPLMSLLFFLQINKMKKMQQLTKKSLSSDRKLNSLIYDRYKTQTLPTPSRNAKLTSLY